VLSLDVDRAVGEERPPYGWSAAPAVPRRMDAMLAAPRREHDDHLHRRIVPRPGGSAGPDGYVARRGWGVRRARGSGLSRYVGGSRGMARAVGYAHADARIGQVMTCERVLRAVQLASWVQSRGEQSLRGPAQLQVSPT